jgi:iron(III) transport system substrate-binding protein
VAEGFPIKIIYPEDKTSYSLVGAGLLKTSKNVAEAKHFIDWLIQDEAYEALQLKQFFFIPTNPATHIYKSYADKKLNLAEYDPLLTATQRQKLLDNWVQTVRFSSR